MVELELDQNNPLIRFKLEGEQFNNGYNLYYLTNSLTNFQRILDKSYLTIVGKNKMTEKDRDIFIIKSSEFKDGSFITDLSMHILTATQLSMYSYGSLSPNDIWHLTKHGFEYLKTVLERFAQGEQMKLEGDGNMFNVIGNNNQVIFQVHPKALTFINKAEHNFEQLSKLIDSDKGVESIAITNLVDKEEDKITISSREKQLFESKTDLESEVIVFKGKIIKINGVDFTGRLLVTSTDDDDIEPNCEYNFDFISKAEEKLEEMKNGFMTTKKIEALKETTIEPKTLKKRVKRFMIIKIK